MAKQQLVGSQENISNMDMPSTIAKYHEDFISPIQDKLNRIADPESVSKEIYAAMEERDKINRSRIAELEEKITRLTVRVEKLEAVQTIS